MNLPSMGLVGRIAVDLVNLPVVDLMDIVSMCLAGAVIESVDLPAVDQPAVGVTESDRCGFDGQYLVDLAIVNLVGMIAMDLVNLPGLEIVDLVAVDLVDLPGPEIVGLVAVDLVDLSDVDLAGLGSHGSGGCGSCGIRSQHNGGAPLI